jgi:sodium-dependent dicarboxylate transporter 2/3/5
MKRFLLLAGPLLFLLVLLLPSPLSGPQQNMAAIMALVVCWWLGALVPLPVTGLLGITLATLLGVSGFEGALRGFANPVVFLFMGGFFMARAMQVHELDRWIAEASLSLRLVKGSPARILICISVVAAGLSAFLSNTATAAMFIPISLSLFTHLKVKEDHPSYQLLLMVAYASTIGGISTPLGSTPNVIALSFLDKLAGVKVNFLEWVLQMFPLMLFCLGGLFFVFRRELRALPDLTGVTFAPPAPLTTPQRRLLVLLSCAVLLWILPGFLQLLLGQDHALTREVAVRLPEAVVAVLMSGLMFLIPAGSGRPLFRWEEAQLIDWGTLLLFGSGISLGLMMFETGLAAYLGQQLPFQHMPFAIALLLIAAITLFSTELVSNTATANLLIPLAITTAPFDAAPLLPVLCIALSANMAFMLPVGTPPNAIAFGSGKIQISWMLRKGIQLNLICLLGIWVLGLLKS